MKSGAVPKLSALGLFNGTVYPWNRACYGVTDGKPHLRIENRVLPAGPTVSDEIANAAFWLGMMAGMPDSYRNPPSLLSFDLARSNFMRAAKMGLDARLTWVGGRLMHVRDLILDELLPIAREGLRGAEVAEDDITRLMDIVEARVSMRKTGALWMYESFSGLIGEGNRYEAAVTLTAEMARYQKRGGPVHTWNLADRASIEAGVRRFRLIEQVMSTDLYTVSPNDSVELIMHIMGWKRIRHLLVEDGEGLFLGLVGMTTVMSHLSPSKKSVQEATVADIMIKNPVSVAPGTPTLEALRIMEEQKTDCLPVIVDQRLVGVVTEKDFTRIAAVFLRETSPFARENREIPPAPDQAKP